MIESSKPAYTPAEVIEQFRNAMLDAGVYPPTYIIGDGALHRFHVEGDKRSTLNAAYTLHMDNRPSGWFMSFKSGISQTWTLSGKREKLSPELIRQIEYTKQLRAQEQAEQHRKAAEKARWIWSNAKPITRQADHPYLAKKRVQAHGARNYRGALVIPLYDESGALCNLQFIDLDGVKRFLSGGRKKSCCSILGEISETILICEGFSTGASLHESTGHYVVVALDAGNLEPVAKIIRCKYPDSNIIIAGDNDGHGHGQEKARDAALACGGKVFIPPDVGDWNDHVCNGGRIDG